MKKRKRPIPEAKGVVLPKVKGREARTGCSARERLFVAHYARTGDAKESARLAGYPAARVEGLQLLKLERVQTELRSFANEMVRDTIADAKERQETLTAIMRDTQQETKDRIKAIEVLGRMQGDFAGKNTGDRETRTILVYPVPMPAGAETATHALPAGHAFEALDGAPSQHQAGQHVVTVRDSRFANPERGAIEARPMPTLDTVPVAPAVSYATQVRPREPTPIEIVDVIEHVEALESDDRDDWIHDQEATDLDYGDFEA